MQRLGDKSDNLIAEPMKSVTYSLANMQFGLKNYSNPISQPLQTESGLSRVLYSLRPDFTGKG